MTADGRVAAATCPRAPASPRGPGLPAPRLSQATALAGRLASLPETAAPARAAPLDQAARNLTALVEALAGIDVWAGPDGEAAASLLSQLIEGGASLDDAYALVQRAAMETWNSGTPCRETLRTRAAASSVALDEARLHELRRPGE